VRRDGTLRALLLLAPLLFGFDPMHSRNGDVERGNALMKEGKAEEALKHYDSAAKALPGDAGVHFDRGTALYALQRFDEAGQEFLTAGTNARDGALKAQSFYNLGNAFFKKEKFKEAVEAYKRTLALDPRDQRAKWNLEIALRKQKDQEEKDKKDQDKNKDDKKDDKDKQDKDKQDDKKDQDKKDQDKGKDDKNKKEPPKDDQKKDEQKNEAPKPQTPDEKDLGAVLDSLERSPKDLEKERARLRAIRRRPPARDW